MHALASQWGIVRSLASTMEDRAASKVMPLGAISNNTNISPTMESLTDMISSPQMAMPVSSFSTLQPIKSRGRVAFGFSGSKAEVVPASNRVSLKVLEHERQQRLILSNTIKYKYMLLPDSMTRYCWDLLMALVTIILMWRIPYSISFPDGGKKYWNIFYRVTDAIYILDIIANFRYVKQSCGQVHALTAGSSLASELHSDCLLWRASRTGFVVDTDVIMDSRKVAKRYLKVSRCYDWLVLIAFSCAGRRTDHLSPPSRIEGVVPHRPRRLHPNRVLCRWHKHFGHRAQSHQSIGEVSQSSGASETTFHRISSVTTRRCLTSASNGSCAVTLETLSHRPDHQVCPVRSSLNVANFHFP